MAVENKYAFSSTYVTALAQFLKLIPAGTGGTGQEVRLFCNKVPVAAGDDNGSVYRVFPGVASTIRPIIGLIATSGMTGSNDADLGLWVPTPPNGVAGAEVDGDCLADGLDLSSALDLGTGTALDGLDAMAITTFGWSTLWELANQTIANRHSQFDIGLRLNTAGSQAGDVVVAMLAMV